MPKGIRESYRVRPYRRSRNRRRVRADYHGEVASKIPSSQDDPV